MSLLNVVSVTKTYQTRFQKREVAALKGVDFKVQAGEFISIMGESGSGKTSLLNCIATLDKPTSGSIFLNDQDLARINDQQSAIFRREQLGFVFQDFNLLNTMSAKDNVLLPLVLNKSLNKKTKEKYKGLIYHLSIEKLMDKYPYELSGGEKQRVAIARALISSPQLLLADEPSGALDSKTSKELFELFVLFNQLQQTILMVTHSALAASYSQRVLLLKDGLVVDEILRNNQSNLQFQNHISERLNLSLENHDAA